MRSRFLAPVATAAIVFTAGGAAAQDACQSSFEAYGSPKGTVTCRCDGDASNGVVYGTGTYTADSDICTAARHAGVISGGGVVQAQGAPGCPAYEGSSQNDITSYDWTSHTASFLFPILGTTPCAVASNQQAPSGQTQAQPAPQPAPAPSTGDALALLLGFLQAAPPGMITYADAKSLGPTAFEVSGILVKPEPGEQFEIAKLMVDNIDMAGLMQGGPPNTLKLRIEGLVIDRATSSADADLFELLGTDRIVSNLAIDYLLDPATRSFTLNDSWIELPGYGSIGASVGLLNVGMEAIMSPEMAAFQAQLVKASVRLEDQSFVARALAMGVKEEGRSEDELMQEALQEIADSLADMGAQPGGPTYQLAQAFAGLLTDNKSPKGPFIVTLEPNQPLGFAQLGETDGPDEAAQLLNMQVSYAGSRATLPEPTAVPPSDVGVFTDKDVYKTGEPVIVFWTGLPGGQKDWVNVVRSGAPTDDWGDWTYTDGQTDGYFEVTGLTPGSYEARIHFDDALEYESSYPFSVTE